MFTDMDKQRTNEGFPMEKRTSLFAKWFERPTLGGARRALDDFEATVLFAYDWSATINITHGGVLLSKEVTFSDYFHYQSCLSGIEERIADIKKRYSLDEKTTLDIEVSIELSRTALFPRDNKIVPLEDDVYEDPELTRSYFSIPLEEREISFEHTPKKLNLRYPSKTVWRLLDEKSGDNISEDELKKEADALLIELIGTTPDTNTIYTAEDLVEQPL